MVVWNSSSLPSGGFGPHWVNEVYTAWVLFYDVKWKHRTITKELNVLMLMLNQTLFTAVLFLTAMLRNH
jgi:hypothetical protein